MKRGGELRIGISGWRYPAWRRKFYPKGLPQRRELEYANRILTSGQTFRRFRLLRQRCQG